ncbi:MAG: hypothetical protein AAGN82_16815 [Myxococcota bacterium]
MTDEMFDAILRKAECEKKGDHAVLPEGRTLSLYVAHGGSSLTVSRIVEVTRDGELVEARNAKGELFILTRSDVFAASVVGGSKDGPSRKAGFLAG